jgi:hypothetical protein
MKVDRTALESFLLTNAPDASLVERAMSAAAPAFGVMEAGTYPLPAKSAVDFACTAAALQRLSGRPVSLETVSLALPSGMDQEVWHDSVWRRVKGRITPWTDQGMVIGGGGTSLHEFLDRSYFDATLRKLCPTHNFRDSVFRRFCQCFTATVPVSEWCAAALPTQLRNISHNGGTLRLNFLTPLHSLFQAVLLGDAEALLRLEPLVRLLPQVVPLGMDADGRWLIPVQ